MRLSKVILILFISLLFFGNASCGTSDPMEDDSTSPQPDTPTADPSQVSPFPASPTPDASPSVEPSSPTPDVDVDHDGYTPGEGDCDDTNPLTSPGSEELCDAQDNDCDGLVDEGEIEAFIDADGDGFGSGAKVLCLLGENAVAQRGDCDDADPLFYPGAREIGLDGLDNDCGGTDDSDPHVGLDSTSRESIQAALDAAVPGVTIWVGMGRYYEHNLNYRGKSVSLISTGLATGSIIDANESGPGFTFESGEGHASVLDGFTVTNGYGENGGGVSVVDSSPTLVGCVIEGNSVENGYEGGGLYFDGSESILTDCSVIANSSGGGIAIRDSSIKMDRCLVTDNSAGTGGGIDLFNAKLHLSRSLIRGNSAIDGGGGISAYESSIEIYRSALVDNRVYGDYPDGGAIQLHYSTLVADNVVIYRNGGASCGGGISLRYSTASFAHTVAVANATGGKYLGTGGGLCIVDSTATVDRCIIYGNFASYYGGISSGGNSQLQVQRSFIAANSALVGNPIVGGIAGEADELRIHQSVLSYNSGYYESGYNLFISGVLSSDRVMWNGLYNPEGQYNHNVPDLDSSNLTLEPRFLAYHQEGLPADPHLALDSPLIDASDPEQADPDGTRADIGIFGGEDGDTWDLDCDGLPTWFWPGSYADVPAGVDASKYDADTVPLSSDWSTWPCLTAPE